MWSHFYEWPIRNMNMFMPHGQCLSVHMGGHVQTGGGGMIFRGYFFYQMLKEMAFFLNIEAHTYTFSESMIKILKKFIWNFCIFVGFDFLISMLDGQLAFNFEKM